MARFGEEGLFEMIEAHGRSARTLTICWPCTPPTEEEIEYTVMLLDQDGKVLDQWEGRNLRTELQAESGASIFISRHIVGLLWARWPWIVDDPVHGDHQVTCRFNPVRFQTVAIK